MISFPQGLTVLSLDQIWRKVVVDQSGLQRDPLSRDQSTIPYRRVTRSPTLHNSSSKRRIEKTRRIFINMIKLYHKMSTELG